MPPKIILKHLHLFVKALLLHAKRRFEKRCRVLHHAGLSLAVRELREADEVEHERRGQSRIASLPVELQAHRNS